MFPIKDENPTEIRPYSTIILIIINFFIFIFQISLNQSDQYNLITNYGFKPDHFFGEFKYF